MTQDYDDTDAMLNDLLARGREVPGSAVRTRDEQVSEIHEATAKQVCSRRPDYPREVYRAYLNAQLAQAEVRGAEEQRRKDAEGQVPIAWLIEDPLKGRPGCAHLIDRASTNRAYAENMETLNFDVSPLYTHPANVAALEAEERG